MATKNETPAGNEPKFKLTVPNFDMKKIVNEAAKIKKLTVRKVFGDTSALTGNIPADGTLVPLMRVAGIAERMATVTGDFGDSVKFTGDFVGINLQTELSVRASVLYLPPVVEGDLARALEKELENEKSDGVTFAFDIYAQYDGDAKNARKFTFCAKLPGEVLKLELPKQDRLALAFGGE